MSKTSENQTSTADEKSDINRDFFLVLNGDENSHQNKKAKEKDENVCNFCQKNLSSNCTLRRHMKIYHSSKISLPVYCCDHCDLKFIKKGSLISHLKSKHQKGKEIKFECDFDGKIFDSKAKIYSHMKACHRIVEECNLCGKKVQVLNQHMRQVHATEDEKVQCQICNKTCKNQKTLKIHLKIHNKQHQCQICGRKFANSAQLKIHLIFHKNQFAFRCEICQKNFTSPSNFRTHLKTHEKKKDQKSQMQTM
ncbi:hypothetical protein PVAND_017422 [Polypedilum vanderplanki]|uniref:C2H2-type domain-containing protein n=1 Tax=Polypedilum vanderplanki TaxID=319348 RepID=A0A9J6BIZ9_POLVA|nr:hypothetical protein PVAND_017422 [Polypedilum vanderplanki]